MGNDLRFPLSQSRNSLESSENEAKIQLNKEIERISNQIAMVTNIIDHAELKLKQTTQNINYYKAIVTNLSAYLQKLHLSQINENLIKENYTEQTQLYLAVIRRVTENEGCLVLSDDGIKELQERVSLLEAQIQENEAEISKNIGDL